MKKKIAVFVLCLPFIALFGLIAWVSIEDYLTGLTFFGVVAITGSMFWALMVLLPETSRGLPRMKNPPPPPKQKKWNCTGRKCSSDCIACKNETASDIHFE